MKVKLLILYLSLVSFMGTIGMGAVTCAQEDGSYKASLSSEKSSQKKAKKKNLYKSRPSRKKYEGEAQLNFVDSEDGYWNARNISDPAFTGNGASLNSVMFESRPGRGVKSLPTGPVRDSEVEFVGGKSMEVIVNGRKVEMEDEQEK